MIGVALLNNGSIAPIEVLWGKWWTPPRLSQGVGRPEYKELRGS